MEWYLATSQLLSLMGFICLYEIIIGLSLHPRYFVFHTIVILRIAPSITDVADVPRIIVMLR